MVHFPFNRVKELELSHNCAKRQVRAWGRFFLQCQFEIYSYTQFEMRGMLARNFFFTLKLSPVFNRHVPVINHPVIITLYNVCAVPWGCLVPWGVQYCGGYHEYRGGYFEYRGVFSTVGDIMINVGGYLEYRGGYHEYRGGYLEYRGGCSVPWGIS